MNTQGGCVASAHMGLPEKIRCNRKFGHSGPHRGYSMAVAMMPEFLPAKEIQVTVEWHYGTRSVREQVKSSEKKEMV